MRNLKSFIVESVHVYDYTIKIAGQLDDKFLELFSHNLKKFDPIEITKPKTTPIQKSPYGFPGVKNEPVNIIKCKFRYPATEPMIRQMAQLLGLDMNRVRVIDTAFDDSIDAECKEYENEMEHSPLLTHEEMEEQPGAKEASKAYGDSYLTSIKDQSKDDKIDIPYAGKRTSDSFDPFKPYLDDKQLGNKSPMTKISRPAKPKTGAMGN